MKKRKACRSRIPCAPAPRGARSRGVCPEDVNQRQLRMGIKVEREHGASKAKACRTSLDHIVEHGDYYTRHRKAGL